MVCTRTYPTDVQTVKHKSIREHTNQNAGYGVACVVWADYIRCIAVIIRALSIFIDISDYIGILLFTKAHYMYVYTLDVCVY